MNKLEQVFKYKVWFILILIIAFAGIVRIYKITEVPPSISWDEAAVGYNAWTIASYGRDERGNFFPAYFISFLDDKHPVHIYLTAIFVKILGLSELSVRLPSVFFGTLNVLIIFFLGRVVFKNNLIGLIASFLLAISPYAIHFSRFNHELNFTVFFFLLSLYLFFKGLDKKNGFLGLSFLTFGVTFLSYHSPKIIVPIVLILLFVLFYNELKSKRTDLLIGLILIFLIGGVVFFNPALLGISRAKQTLIPDDLAKKTYIFSKTENLSLGKVNVVLSNYLSHFSYDYLFKNGDKNPRLSSRVTGEFYLLDLPFLILGSVLILLSRKKTGLVILIVAILAPLAASFSTEVPHAARAMFSLGSWQIIEAYGIYRFLTISKLGWVQIITGFILLFFFLLNFNQYCQKYYSEYAKRYAIDWQYGMKQIVEYVQKHPEYKEVYMTNVRSQPYIFFLFYTKKPLEEYVKEVEYNNSHTRSFNLVSAFDRYIFEYWEPIEVFPQPARLYVVTSSQYDGLRYINDFEIKKIVYFPDGGTAFYLIAAK